jgi:hypothetical protein
MAFVIYNYGVFASRFGDALINSGNVIPAKAGIQKIHKLGSRLRGNDKLINISLDNLPDFLDKVFHATCQPAHSSRSFLACNAAPLGA